MYRVRRNGASHTNSHRLIALTFVVVVVATVVLSSAPRRPSRGGVAVASTCASSSRQLTDWLEYHRAIGVTRFYIFEEGMGRQQVDGRPTCTFLAGKQRMKTKRTRLRDSRSGWRPTTPRETLRAVRTRFSCAKHSILNWRLRERRKMASNGCCTLTSTSWCTPRVRRRSTYETCLRVKVHTSIAWCSRTTKPYLNARHTS